MHRNTPFNGAPGGKAILTYKAIPTYEAASEIGKAGQRCGRCWPTMDALAADHDAAVQTIDTSVVRIKLASIRIWLRANGSAL